MTELWKLAISRTQNWTRSEIEYAFHGATVDDCMDI